MDGSWQIRSAWRAGRKELAYYVLVYVLYTVAAPAALYSSTCMWLAMCLVTFIRTNVLVAACGLWPVGGQYVLYDSTVYSVHDTHTDSTQS